MYDAPDKIAYGKLVLSFTRDLLNGVPMFDRNYSLMPFPFSWNFTEDRYYEYKARKKNSWCLMKALYLLQANQKQTITNHFKVYKH